MQCPRNAEENAKKSKEIRDFLLHFSNKWCKLYIEESCK